MHPYPCSHGGECCPWRGDPTADAVTWPSQGLDPGALTGDGHLEQNSSHWLYSLDLKENKKTPILLCIHHKPSGISKKKNKGTNRHSLISAQSDNWKVRSLINQWRRKRAGSSGLYWKTNHINLQSKIIWLNPAVISNKQSPWLGFGQGHGFIRLLG